MMNIVFVGLLFVELVISSCIPVYRNEFLKCIGEDGGGHLRCGMDDQVIKIRLAVYAPDSQKPRCSTDVTPFIRNLCQNKPTCEVLVSDEDLRVVDKCQTENKVLKIAFGCYQITENLTNRPSTNHNSLSRNPTSLISTATRTTLINISQYKNTRYAVGQRTKRTTGVLTIRSTNYQYPISRRTSNSAVVPTDKIKNTESSTSKFIISTTAIAAPVSFTDKIIGRFVTSYTENHRSKSSNVAAIAGGTTGGIILLAMVIIGVLLSRRFRGKTTGEFFLEFKTIFIRNKNESNHHIIETTDYNNGSDFEVFVKTL